MSPTITRERAGFSDFITAVVIVSLGTAVVNLGYPEDGSRAIQLPM